MTTIADRIAERNRVWINRGVCTFRMRSTWSSWERLGPDHGAMHDDLTPRFTRKRCLARAWWSGTLVLRGQPTRPIVTNNGYSLVRVIDAAR